MKFGNPGFLFALFLLAIPVIIHLFHFRKIKTIYFTNVRFLKQVQQQSQSYNRLKHLLILISRLLALAFLIFAFAKPYFPSLNKNEAGDKIVSIYVDNSFSMESTAEVGSLFEQAKKNASEIALAYKQTDRFLLLTNDFETKHQRPVTRDNFLTLLDEVSISPGFKNITQVLERQKKSLNETEQANKIAFLISDFQESFINQTAANINDTIIVYNWIKLNPQTTTNLSIDSVWFSKPARALNVADELQVYINNQNTISLENASLNLLMDGQQKAMENFSIGADSSINKSLSFILSKAGKYASSVQVKDYPITYDDTLYFAFDIAENTLIYEIKGSESNSAISAFLSSRTEFKTTSAAQEAIDFQQLNSNNLIVLNGIASVSTGLEAELVKASKNGVNIVLFPAENLDLTSFNKLSLTLGIPEFTALQKQKIRCDYINLKGTIYSDVFEKVPDNIDLPNTNSYFGLNKTKLYREQKHLALQNGDVFFAEYQNGNATVFVFTSPLKSEISNFTQHGIFAPTLYKIATNSGNQQQLSYTIGKNEPIKTKQINLGNEATYNIKSLDKSVEFLPEHRNIDGRTEIYVSDQIKKAGIYALYQSDSLLQYLAFNYNRNESKTKFATEVQLNEKMREWGISKGNIIQLDNSDASLAISRLSEGEQIWHWFIIFALIMLIVETLFIRYLK